MILFRIIIIFFSCMELTISIMSNDTYHSPVSKQQLYYPLFRFPSSRKNKYNRRAGAQNGAEG